MNEKNALIKPIKWCTKVLFFVAFAKANLFGQTVVNKVWTDTTISFRGMAAVHDSLVFISGTKGTILKYSIQQDQLSGLTIPKKYNAVDFRDIKHLGNNSLLAIGVASPAYIIRSNDLGETWTEVFADSAKNVFLNGAIVLNNNRVLVYGDPDQSGTYDLLLSTNSCKSFTRLPSSQRPKAGENGGMFAASGTSGILLNDTLIIAVQSKNGVALIKKHQELHPSEPWIISPSSFLANGSSGIFSLASHNNQLFSFGGDYKQPNLPQPSAWKYDPKDWETLSENFPCGYYSCGAVNDNAIVATGSCGTTLYNRVTKKTTSTEVPFHTCRIINNRIYLAGPKGSFAVMQL